FDRYLEENHSKKKKSQIGKNDGISTSIAISDTILDIGEWNTLEDQRKFLQAVAAQLGFTSELGWYSLEGIELKKRSSPFYVPFFHRLYLWVFILVFII